MIRTFKQYLFEARQAPLYHGTLSSNAESILRQNKIDVNRAEFENKPAVSLSRSFAYAKKWAWQLGGGAKQNAVVFELDQQKLSYNYRIVPHNYFYYNVEPEEQKARYLRKRYEMENEYEEYVTKNISPLSRYLKAIHIFERDINLQLGKHPLIKYKGKFINQ